MSLKIIGMGKGIPEKSITNDDLAAYLDTSDEWIFSRTGIRSRHVRTWETQTDLSAAAAREAIEKSGLAASAIDLVICSTLGGDYVTPSLACCVSERLGIKCPAFDVNAACSGFIYTLDIASCYLSAGKAQNILIVCAESMSTWVDWNDRNTCVLFGDGAAACVAVSGNAIKHLHLSSDPSTTLLNIPAATVNSPFFENKVENGVLYMRGQEVFRFAINTIEAEMKQALHTLDMAPEDIDWFLLHQANKRIIDAARTRLKQPVEKFPVNMAEYGNLSSVTIPLMMSGMLDEGKIKPGDVLFMAAFGGGLTFGSCVMVWE